MGEAVFVENRPDHPFVAPLASNPKLKQD